MTTTIPPRSIAARAADGGLIMGALIMILVLSVGFASVIPGVSLLVWIGSLAVPFVLYYLLRRSYAETDYKLSIIELWAEGIAMFFFGSLVPAAVTYLLLRFAAPDFMENQLNLAITELSKINTTPEGDELITTLTTIRDSGLLPTPTQVAAQLIASNMMIGMILSLIEASLLVFRYRNPARRQKLNFKQ